MFKGHHHHKNNKMQVGNDDRKASGKVHDRKTSTYHMVDEKLNEEILKVPYLDHLLIDSGLVLLIIQVCVGRRRFV